jgi:hypothetical protein
VHSVWVLAAAGRIAEGKRRLEEMLTRLGDEARAHWDVALWYAALGEHDQALAWIEGWLERERDRPPEYLRWSLIGLALSPLLDPMRSDPRFLALLERLGLPP